MNIYPSSEDFSRKKGRRLVWAVLPADLETPVSVTLKLKDEKYCCLFESVEQGKNRGRYSFIATSPDLLWKCENGKPYICDNLTAGDYVRDGDDVFASLRKILNDAKLEIPEQLPPMSAGVFGYMGYDMVRYMEKLPDNNPDTIGISESIFMRPKVVIVFDSVKDQMFVITVADSEEKYNEAVSRIEDVVKKLEKNISHNCLSGGKLGAVKSNTTRDEYHQMVKKAKDYILAGDIFQVVPGQRFTVDFPFEAIELYRVLRSMNPSPYSFYMQMDGFALVGSSPEILVRAREGKATVRPIAGTRKRGADESEDENLAKDLLSDEKELAEHLMLIDLGRNDIGRVAKTGTVKVTEREVIEYYSHVMHIVSNVEGELKENVDALDAVIAGFPVGTVSGAPKIRAMEIIDELEKERRSFYAGGVGYFSADGSVDMCIALRTGLVKDGVLYVQAGGGVVSDSDPEAEYQESCNKARALIAAAEEVARRNG